MASDRGSRSLSETSSREDILGLTKQGLRLRLGATERQEAQPLLIEQQFTADESMAPEWIDGKGAAEQGNDAMLARPPQKDNASVQRRLKVELPRSGKRTPSGCRLPAARRAVTARDHVLTGVLAERLQRAVTKAGPDLRLPSPVEILDGVLKSGLPRGREDGHDPQTEAQAHDAPHDITMLVGALKPIVIVELCVGGQPDVAPMGDQRLDDLAGGQGRAWPRANHAAMQRRRRQDFDFSPVGQHQAFHDVTAIQLGLPCDDIGQIPAGPRGDASNAPAIVKRPAALENPADGADGRTRGGHRVQHSGNGLRPKFTERTLVFEFAAQCEDQIFGRGVGPVDRVCDMRAIIPVHSVQSLPRRARDPALHRVQTHTMSPRNGAKGSASTGHRDDGLPPRREGIFFSIRGVSAIFSGVENGLWNLPEPWTHRTLPPLLGKRTERVSHSSHRHHRFINRNEVTGIRCQSADRDPLSLRRRHLEACTR